MFYVQSSIELLYTINHYYLYNIYGEPVMTVAKKPVNQLLHILSFQLTS